jgi:haloacetate dehalogenase
MPDLADLFPGFGSEWINTSKGRVFARVGGSGPPLILFHGYPQTHVMWHKVAPDLSQRFTLVIPDLPGYGWSDIPETDKDHLNFSKRAWAQTMVEVMEKLGHVRFGVVGHDRGGRVAYRLALDHPGRISRLATLDIVPTYDYWAGMGRARAVRSYHWSFLAQHEPLPETMIGANPRLYFKSTLAGWGRATKEEIFDPRAMEHYLKALEAPERIHAICEDYRAGAFADFEIDKADVAAGNKIKMPMLALWGSAGLAAAHGPSPLEVWQRWADNVHGEAIEAGHFIAEENPQATVASLTKFFLEQN